MPDSLKGGCLIPEGTYDFFGIICAFFLLVPIFRELFSICQNFTSERITLVINKFAFDSSLTKELSIKERTEFGDRFSEIHPFIKPVVIDGVKFSYVYYAILFYSTSMFFFTIFYAGTLINDGTGDFSKQFLFFDYWEPAYLILFPITFVSSFIGMAVSLIFCCVLVYFLISKIDEVASIIGSKFLAHKINLYLIYFASFFIILLWVGVNLVVVSTFINSKYFGLLGFSCGTILILMFLFFVYFYVRIWIYYLACFTRFQK